MKAVLDAKKCEAREFYRNGIDKLKDNLSQGRRIALMRSELEPHECHRGCVLGKTLDNEGVAVIHIGKHSEPLSQSQIRETKYQEALF